MKKTTKKPDFDLEDYLKTVEKENAQMKAGTWPKPSPPVIAKAVNSKPESKQALPPVSNPDAGTGTLIVLSEVIEFRIPPEIGSAIAAKQRERDILFEYRENLATLRTAGHFSKALEVEGAAFREAARTGDIESFDHQPLTRHEREDVYATKKSTVNEALAQVIREAAVIARPYLEKFKTAALAYVADLEKKESDVAAQFYLDFQPSATIHKLRKIIATLDKRIPSPEMEMFQNPIQFLPPFKK